MLNRWGASLVGPSPALIYYIGHNKNCIFLFLASFQPNIDPVYQQRQRKAHCDESAFYNPEALQSWAPRRRSDTSVNLFTVSLLSKRLRRPVIKALNILKLFNHSSQDLQSRRSFDSFHGKNDSKIFHTLSLGCLACGVQLFFCLHEQIFTICNIPNCTRPHNVQQLGFPLSDDGCVFLCVGKISTPFLVYFGDNIFRTPVG